MTGRKAVCGAVKADVERGFAVVDKVADALFVRDLCNEAAGLQFFVNTHVDDIYKAAEGIDAAKPRPNLVIKSVAEGIKFAANFTKAISKLWEDEGLKNDASIEEWKKIRYKKFAPDWCKDDNDIFNRICNGDKSVNAIKLKKRYPDHKDDIASLDKDLRVVIVGKIMEPMDNLFLSIGNELIDLLDEIGRASCRERV